jgi:hypothetical protein
MPDAEPTTGLVLLPLHHEVLSALAGRLEAAVHQVAGDDVPGHDRFCAADPFGNRLEFLHVASRS